MLLVQKYVVTAYQLCCPYGENVLTERVLISQSYCILLVADVHAVMLCRHKYLRSWFFLDAFACLPLQCILFAAAPTVNWYNTPNFTR